VRHLDEVVRDRREAPLGRLQLVEVGGGHLLRRDLGRQALELGPHEKGLAQLLAREQPDAHAAIRLERDEAERGEPPQRLAHRGPADLELLGEVLLPQHAARRDLTGHDRLLQREREVVGFRSVGH
jgi:hypothetical protein